MLPQHPPKIFNCLIEWSLSCYISITIPERNKKSLNCSVWAVCHMLLRISNSQISISSSFWLVETFVRIWYWKLGCNHCLPHPRVLECINTQNFSKPDPNSKIGFFSGPGPLNSLNPDMSQTRPNPKYSGIGLTCNRLYSLHWCNHCLPHPWEAEGRLASTRRAKY